SRAYARQALALDGNMPEPHAELGMEALSNRWNWVEGAREMQLALRSQVPESWMPYMMECWAVGRKEQAFRLVRKALEQQPISVVWRLKQADLFLQTNQPDAAGKVYESVIADARDDPRAYFALAEVRSEQQRFDDAIALIRQAYVAAGMEDHSFLASLATEKG